MAVTFRVDRRGLDTLLRSPSGPMGRDVAGRAQRVAGRAQRLAPVRTGALRASIRAFPVQRGRDGPVAMVGATVDYANYVELGTRYMRARPFLRPALAAAAGR